MKAIFKLSLLALGSVFLGACSNQNTPPKTKIVDTRVVEVANGSKVTILTQNAINGDVIEDTDNNLNVVYKSENAKLIGLKVAQFAAMFLGGASGEVSGYNKEQLKGEHIAAVNNRTMEYLNPELDAIINKMDIPTGRENKIIVEPYKFKLIYDGLDSDKYEFRYSTVISSGDFVHTCSSSELLSTERIRSIDEWEKNNFELTQLMTKKIIEKCVNEIGTGDEKAKLAKVLTSADVK